MAMRDEWSTMVSVAVLLAAAWPAYRLLSIPPFRRWYGCFALRVGGLLLLYIAAIAAIVWWIPRLLPAGAAVALAGLAAERWRARRDYGRARRLPPGRLDLVPRGPWVDEAYYRRQAERYGPVFKMNQFFRPMVCVVGTQRGLALFREHSSRMHAPLVRFSTLIPRGFIRHMEREDHVEYRRILQSALGHTFDATLRRRIESRVHDGLDELAQASHRAGGHGVHPRRCIEDLLLGLFVEVFTGLGEHSPDFERLCTLYGQIDIRKSGCGSTDHEMVAAREIASIIERQGRRLFSVTGSEASDRPAAQPPAPSSLLAQILAAEPARVDDPTLLLNLVYMIQVGRLDVAGLLNWIVQMLVDHPTWVERVRKESGESGLAARVVKETLRLEQSEFLFRRVTEDLEFEGFRIPKGWLVRVCIRDGHRDPTHFRDPDRFDPDRFLDPQFSGDAYSPLGFLQRGCLGGRLIDLIGTAFVTHLATTYDLEKIADGPREYGRAHWEPSSRLRLRLHERSRLA